jgi:protein translocase SecG subunit
MNQILTIAQLVVSILLIISIILQQRGGSLGSAFGGSDTSYATRRGAEKYIFWVSVVLTIAFIILALLNFLY